MKPEEVLDNINNKMLIQARRNGKYIESEMMKVIIESLEKQIAKKPIPEELNDGSTWNHCPCCNQVWQDKQHCCHYCGQKINWEETP